MKTATYKIPDFYDESTDAVVLKEVSHNVESMEDAKRAFYSAVEEFNRWFVENHGMMWPCHEIITLKETALVSV